MRLLLLLPDGEIHRVGFGRFRISLREAPLTLTMLAALVPPELEARIRLVDGSVEPIPWNAKADLVGISCLTGTAPRAYRMAARFRARGVPVVLGGVHVTLRPEEAARHADAIVTGFAERAWPALLRDFAAGRMRPVYEGGQPDLAGLPRPRRDLQRRFAYAAPRTVFATRGCTNACDFCAVPAAAQVWRTRPVGEVIDEIRALPGRRFVFNDVSLAEDRDYAIELLTALVPLRRAWGGLITARSAADEPLLDLMARSGCQYLLLGFESADGDTLRGIRKGFNDAVPYRRLMAAMHARGISVQGCFIFGLDGDTPEVFDRTTALVQDLRIDIPRYAIYTPYPGTEAFERLEREGRLLHRDWSRYDTRHAVFQPSGMSPADLEAGYRRAYRETFRLRAIRHRLAASPRRTIALIGNLAYRRFARRLPAKDPSPAGPAQDGSAA